MQAQNRTVNSPKSPLSHPPWLFNLGSDPTQLHVLVILFQPFLSVPITLPFYVPIASFLDSSKSLVTDLPKFSLPSAKFYTAARIKAQI